ncbi:hypothetical protein DEO72_LG6g1845 [Vigna unguiculata]|uniref:Uncharacterized protein n=1 Tax=Vigna unguiculata TaxID=3917 RepID=A0A4D6M7C6_VIGUN|nr:hypothetical protein DEO72_LG6g1845 [Vigna unguiculata]
MPALEPITLVEKENEVDYQNNQHVDSVIHHSESFVHQNFTVAENLYHNDQHMDCGRENPENDAAKTHDRNENSQIVVEANLISKLWVDRVEEEESSSEFEDMEGDAASFQPDVSTKKPATKENY